MGERKMYNFPFVEDGQTYWRSRSCTVVGYTFCKDKNGYVYVLANKRGPGAPTCRGMWNVVCGYIDFEDQDGNIAVARETYEETGVKLKPEQFTFDSVSFSEDGDKNINLRFWCELQGVIDDYPVSNAANEEGETSDIKWVKLQDVDTYVWAFGQKDTIHEMYDKHIALFNKCAYIVDLEIIIKGTGETVSTETLAICDTREQCKEYTQQHINMMIKANDKAGVEHDAYNITDLDAIVKWKDGDKEWFYWYMFKPKPHYPKYKFSERIAS